MAELTLEIVEGPDAGRQLPVAGTVVIGRSADADIILDDQQVSRQHARVTAHNGSAVVEDLQSANGTYINQAELHGPARLDPGDELLIGVTLLQLRTREEIAIVPSAVRQVPPGLAMAPRTPDYVPPVPPPDEAPPPKARSAGPKELTQLYDVRVRRRANLAPLAIFLLVCLVVAIYLATK
jgi:pSer/pThr/pTyr-binding forkhead associated (FHA) protein